MTLRSSLTVKQSQELTITPQLLQSIKMLQMNVLEIQTEIQTEIEKNPLLEQAEDDYDDDASETTDDLSQEDDETRDLYEELDNMNNLYKESDFLDLDNDYEKPIPRSREEELQRQKFLEGREEVCVRDELLQQLHCSKLTGRQREFGEAILDNLDEYGYFREDLLQLADELNFPFAEAEGVLQVVQTFEPLGLAARNVGECLWLQVPEEMRTRLLEKVLLYHFTLLENRKYSQLIQRLRVSKEEILRIEAFISHLDPKPLVRLGAVSAKYIVPDVIIEEKEDGVFTVELNSNFSPRLRINRYYRSLLEKKKKNLDKNALQYIKTHFHSAEGFIKAVLHRQNTILQISEAIVEKQHAFFMEGVTALKPMTLGDIAEETGLHESTVSRVVNGKYAQTPLGLYELRFFFSSAIGKIGGDDVSSKAVKLQLKAFIDDEDKRKPLSDQKLAELLKKKHFDIARRTVAKYREAMQILPARLRRKEG